LFVQLNGTNPTVFTAYILRATKEVLDEGKKPSRELFRRFFGLTDEEINTLFNDLKNNRKSEIVGRIISNTAGASNLKQNLKFGIEAITQAEAKLMLISDVLTNLATKDKKGEFGKYIITGIRGAGKTHVAQNIAHFLAHTLISGALAVRGWRLQEFLNNLKKELADYLQLDKEMDIDIDKLTTEIGKAIHHFNQTVHRWSPIVDESLSIAKGAVVKPIPVEQYAILKQDIFKVKGKEKAVSKVLPYIVNGFIQLHDDFTRFLSNELAIKHFHLIHDVTSLDTANISPSFAIWGVVNPDRQFYSILRTFYRALDPQGQLNPVNRYASQRFIFVNMVGLGKQDVKVPDEQSQRAVSRAFLASTYFYLMGLAAKDLINKKTTTEAVKFFETVLSDLMDEYKAENLLDLVKKATPSNETQQTDETTVKEEKTVGVSPEKSPTLYMLNRIVAGMAATVKEYISQTTAPFKKALDANKIDKQQFKQIHEELKRRALDKLFNQVFGETYQSTATQLLTEGERISPAVIYSEQILERFNKPYKRLKGTDLFGEYQDEIAELLDKAFADDYYTKELPPEMFKAITTSLSFTPTTDLTLKKFGAEFTENLFIPLISIAKNETDPDIRLTKIQALFNRKFKGKTPDQIADFIGKALKFYEDHPIESLKESYELLKWAIEEAKNGFKNTIGKKVWQRRLGWLANVQPKDYSDVKPELNDETARLLREQFEKAGLGVPDQFGKEIVEEYTKAKSTAFATKLQKHIDDFNKELANRLGITATAQFVAKIPDVDKKTLEGLMGGGLSGGTIRPDKLAEDVFDTFRNLEGEFNQDLAMFQHNALRLLNLSWGCSYNPDTGEIRPEFLDRDRAFAQNYTTIKEASKLISDKSPIKKGAIASMVFSTVGFNRVGVALLKELGFVKKGVERKLITPAELGKQLKERILKELTEDLYKKDPTAYAQKVEQILKEFTDMVKEFIKQNKGTKLELSNPFDLVIYSLLKHADEGEEAVGLFNKEEFQKAIENLDKDSFKSDDALSALDRLLKPFLKENTEKAPFVEINKDTIKVLKDMEVRNGLGAILKNIVNGKCLAPTKSLSNAIKKSLEHLKNTLADECPDMEEKLNDKLLEAYGNEQFTKAGLLTAITKCK
jgi:hypothetical protein